MSDDEFKAAITGLREAQLDVLGQVALGDDRGHHPRTLDALVRRGLIEPRLEKRMFVTITRHDMPLHVHVAWYAWAATKYPLPEGIGGWGSRRDG